jgi:hypothetical protein
MDDTTLMNAGLSTTGVAILLIVVRVLKSLQGKKLVSTCCGRRGEMGMDVVAMTPTPVKAPRKEGLVPDGACPPPPRAVAPRIPDVENPLRLARLETVGVQV